MRPGQTGRSQRDSLRRDVITPRVSARALVESERHAAPDHVYPGRPVDRGTRGGRSDPAGLRGHADEVGSPGEIDPLRPGIGALGHGTGIVQSVAPVVPLYAVTPAAEENSTTPSDAALSVPWNDRPCSGRTRRSAPVGRAILRA